MKNEHKRIVIALAIIGWGVIGFWAGWTFGVVAVIPITLGGWLLGKVLASWYWN